MPDLDEKLTISAPKPINVMLSGQLRDEFEVMMKVYGYTVSELVRQALREKIAALKENKSDCSTD